MSTSTEKSPQKNVLNASDAETLVGLSESDRLISRVILKRHFLKS
jgi:hypothetical protein